MLLRLIEYWSLVMCDILSYVFPYFAKLYYSEDCFGFPQTRKNTSDEDSKSRLPNTQKVLNQIYLG